MFSTAGIGQLGRDHSMNATAQLTKEQSSPPAVGLGRILNNSVALILLDLLNRQFLWSCSRE